MSLLTDFYKLANKCHDIFFPFQNLTRQLLKDNSTESGVNADKVMVQVAKIINSLENPAIRAGIKKDGANLDLIVSISVGTTGLTQNEKIKYGEKLADLVGHHEGQLKYLSHSPKGFSYNIRYIGSNNPESCSRCAQAVVHIKEASELITETVNEIKYITASRKFMLANNFNTRFSQ